MSTSRTSVTSGEKRRTVLKDNSWIRRNAEEDEPVDYDPNFGKVVLGQVKPVDDVSSQSVEAEQTPGNSGTSSVSSLSKRFGGSQELLNKSGTSTKSPVSVPLSPTKPPVPAKNPALKTLPNTQSSFTAKVFSANTSGKVSSPVKASFGEKFPDVTASQTTNGLHKTSSTGSTASSVTISSSSSSSSAPSVTVTSTSTTVKSSAVTTPVTVNSQRSISSSSSSSSVPSVTATSTSTTVKSSAVTTPVTSQSRSESVSISPGVSSSSSVQTTITTTKTSVLEDWTHTVKPAENPSVSLKTSDVSYSPSAMSVNKSYVYRADSAPLDDLADTLLPTLSKSVYSSPVQSQTQVKSVYSETPSSAFRSPLQTLESSRTQVQSVYSETLSSPLRSPLQTLESSRTQVKSVYSETPSSPLRSPLQTLESSRTLSSRDVCSVCGKPIAGGERMILEDLKINSHTSCFRCAMCHCDLGGLEAGKSLWVHRERVNCSNCYSKIRGQWYI